MTIEKSIAEYALACDFLLDDFTTLEGEEMGIYERQRGAFSEYKELLNRIQAIRKRTITLREGVRISVIQYSSLCLRLDISICINKLRLFNASSMFESRASTRLGETVKLLTFVTVFYLPLTFCSV